MSQINSSSPFAPESEAIVKFRQQLQNTNSLNDFQSSPVIENPQSEAVLAVVKQLLDKDKA